MVYNHTMRINYFDVDEILPLEIADPLAYVLAIRGRWKSIISNGLFKQKEFVQVFETRVSTLLRSTQDAETKQKVEIELAYLYQDLSRLYSLIFSTNEELG